MGKNSNKRKLSEEEAVKVITDPDRIVVSLNKIPNLEYRIEIESFAAGKSRT
ncbi:hypothetical protein [Chryseobacterium indologenes]|uniref:hypothetical protein n=1 Tax=Chryseobacterium indologenes TaxID=253 RepID=UPI000B238279|nr:hypothetical protein [Chryseobacterium indologenes]